MLGGNKVLGVKDVDKALSGLEQMMLTQDKVGVIVDYAEMIAPAGDTSFQSESDRRAVVTLHRWSLDRRFDHADNVVFLITEQLTQLSPKLVSNPKIASVSVGLPDKDTRSALIEILEPEASPAELDRLSELSAGLKSVQIMGILKPGGGEEDQADDRIDFIANLLGGTSQAKERAKKLAPKFVGESLEEIRSQLRPNFFQGFTHKFRGEFFRALFGL